MSALVPLVEQLHMVDASRRLLAVWAHPDDESFGPVTTLRRAADEGVALALITATRGEGGESQLPGLDGDALARVREQELLAAAQLIGFEQVQILGHPDGGLEHVEALHRDVERAIAAFRPHVVITFGPDGITGHPDHLAIGAATTLAFARLRVPTGGDGPWKLYYVVPAPGSDPPMMQEHAPPLPPTTMIHAPQYQAVKRAALACHRTQVADVDALVAAEHNSWLTTDYFFRAFPQVAHTTTLEDDIMADV